MIALLFIIWAQDNQPMNWSRVRSLIQALPNDSAQSHTIAELGADRAGVNASNKPQIQAVIEASATTNPVSVFSGKLGNATFDPEDFASFSEAGFDTFPVNHPDAFSDVKVGVSLGYRIWDGGTRKWTLAQLTTAMAAADQAHQQVRNQNWLTLVERIIWRDSLKRQVQRAEVAVRDSRKTLDLVKSLYDEGQVPRVRVAQAQASTAEAVANLNGFQAQRDGLDHAIAAWLDIPLSDVSLLPSIPAVVDADIDATTHAEQAADLRADAMQLAQKAIPKPWNPNIDIVAQYNSHRLSQDNWWAGVRGGWSLFDGGTRRARRDKADASASRAFAEANDTRRAFEQMRSRFNALRSAREAEIRALEAALDSVNESLDAQMALLDEGQLDAGSMFETRRQSIEVEQRLIVAQREYALLGWKIRFANGAELERDIMERTQS